MSTVTGRPGLGMLAALTSMIGADTLAAAAKKATVELPYRLIRRNLPQLRRRERRSMQDRSRPHSAPMLVAVCRTLEGKRRYHQCVTREQALKHSPYLIEHVNGWGQVTRRERLA